MIMAGGRNVKKTELFTTNFLMTNGDSLIIICKPGFGKVHWICNLMDGQVGDIA